MTPLIHEKYYMFPGFLMKRILFMFLVIIGLRDIRGYWKPKPLRKAAATFLRNKVDELNRKSIHQKL